MMMVRESHGGEPCAQCLGALISKVEAVRRGPDRLQGRRRRSGSACLRTALTRTYQWQPGSRLDSWLFRIIQNTWADERKSARSRTQAPIEAATDEIGDDGVRRAEARLTLDNVYRELCNLPEEQRAVLTLVCVDGLSYKEVAEILGIPVGTVMSRVARGRLALADRIEASGGHSADNILKLR